jgi:ATP-binding cassette, subfamily C, bacterial CydCD
MRVWSRLMSFVYPFRGRALLACLFGFLTIAANVGLMGSSGYLIASAALRPETVLLLWVPIVAVRFFGISRGVFRYLERLTTHDVTFRVLSRIRVWLFGQMEARAIDLLETKRSADLLSSAVSDVEQLQHMFLRVLSPTVVACLTAGLGFAVISRFDLALGIVFVVMLMAGGVAIPWLSHRYGRQAGLDEVKLRSRLYVEMGDLLEGLHVLTVNGQAGEAEAKLESLQEELDQVRTDQGRVSAMASAAMLGVSNLTMWLILGHAIVLVATGGLQGLFIPALVLVSLACFEAIAPLPLAYQHYCQVMEAGKRLFQLESAETAEADRAEHAADSMLDASEPRLEVKGLGFCYPEAAAGEASVLRDVSFTLERGRHVAVVGESGAGKSTIVDVLLGLRGYQEGSITLGGYELRGLSDGWVREYVTAVPQEPYWFHASVADNLRLAKPDATATELGAVLQAVQLEAMVRQLPEGLDTVMGEGGARFSGGERQRLGLARALLRPADLILFDEPTAGLDPLTAQAFQQVMAKELKEKGVLWVTHRLSELAHMDEILVLHQGCIIQRGTHDQLLQEQDGMYRRLWQLQHEQIR